MISAQPDRLAVRTLSILFAALLALLIPCARGFASDVVFVRSASSGPAGQQSLQVAAQFYGLGFNVVSTAGARSDDRTVHAAVERSSTVAVVVEAAALAHLDPAALLSALARKSGRSVPLLIVGLTPQTDPALLKMWSGGAIVNCAHLKSTHRLVYALGRVPGVTGQLANIEMPFSGDDTFYFHRNERSTTFEVGGIRDGHQFVPVFVETILKRQRVFLDCTLAQAGASGTEANDDDTVTAFVKLAPAMIFIKYSAGESCWHSPYHFANLTIDDPWLREPYGFVDYKALLAEMDKHNFHSTIAFIPWNYDRSQPVVVSLIRSHPDRFSICIHGDNHDHKEFTDYRSKPLNVQVADLRQALTRMDRFQTLTGIPYDKVMIFPHSIAPRLTLEALNNFGYLATVNSLNVPMDSTRPPGIAFALRPITLVYGGFPSIARYSVAVPLPDDVIAVNEFLDNPLLLYCHHELFESGIGAFDDVADRVNKIQPDTRWRGLGEIARHLYLVKQRDASNYDVLAESSVLDLENTTNRELTFHVTKSEADRAAIASVDAGSQKCPFHIHNGQVEFSVQIPGRQARRVEINYQNSAPQTEVNIQHKSLRVYLLRMASDFRDNILYTNAVGRALIHSYYDDQPTFSGLLECVIVLLISSIGVAWSLRRVGKKRFQPTATQRARRSPDLAGPADGRG